MMFQSGKSASGLRFATDTSTARNKITNLLLLLPNVIQLLEFVTVNVEICKINKPHLTPRQFGLAQVATYRGIRFYDPRNMSFFIVYNP